MRVRRFVVLLAVAALAACAQQTSHESTEITAASGRWVKSFNAGDGAAVAALYTENCRLMPPNADMALGRAAAEAAFDEMIAAGLTAGIDTIETVAAGDIGYHVGTYLLQQPDGSVVDRGKFIEIWRKIGGEWMIANDIWNSDVAPGAGTTTIAITHQVKDPAHWLAAWQGEDSRRDQFAEHGVAGVRLFQDPDAPRMTAVVVDIADMDAFQAFMSSPTAEAAKAEDGVIDASLRTYVEVK